MIYLLSNLQQLDFLHTVQAGFAVHHLKYLNFLQSHRPVVMSSSGSVDNTELALPDLLVDTEPGQGTVGRVRVRQLQQLGGSGGAGAGLVRLARHDLGYSDLKIFRYHLTGWLTVLATQHTTQSPDTGFAWSKALD